ncbi:hypothetical protein [Vibrio cholerae]|uniref:hypothetical protein n=1 Tax=Vibrio cholerae TaxID=666 RepID=UPI00309F63CC|nr:hypothetical protein [Vibrio cholerae]EKO5180218.1 hypothetical protein [Vibrio cholerae]
MKNKESFSVYITRVLGELHQEFPVGVYLNETQIVDECYKYQHQDTLENMRTATGFAEIINKMGTTDDEDLKLDAKEFEPQGADIVFELEEEREQQIKHQMAIFSATIEFLSEEGFIRTLSNGTYALTSKGFIALKKSNRDENSFGEVFERIATGLVNFTKDVTVQTIVAVTSAFFIAAP